MALRVLVVGGGAREHALAWKLAGERAVTELLCAPGNPGAARVARCLEVDPADPAALADLAARERVDLTVVGPEAPLERGVADLFTARGLRLFGPTRAAAQLECSKVFAKEFMARHGVPTARFAVCDTPDAALACLARGDFGVPVVIKADGLAAGKGVVVASDRATAEAAVRDAMIDRRFGAAGARLVIEECLQGTEASFFVLCDGTRSLPLLSAQDHKRVFDDDRGPNTGGMGAFAPSPLCTPGVQSEIMSGIVEPVLRGLKAEGHEYRGFLYVGLMLTADGPKVIEFNVRFGDPEAQVVIPMIDGDLAPLLSAAAQGDLTGLSCRFRPEPHVGVVLASGGYPGGFEAGKVIAGLDAAETLPGVVVFHAGTKLRDGACVTSGGRVLTVVGRGPDFRTAIDRAYGAVSRVSFDGMHYRKDIGRKALPGVVESFNLES
jgi:phosphoribosylamine--glycine ligase